MPMISSAIGKLMVKQKVSPTSYLFSFRFIHGTHDRKSGRGVFYCPENYEVLSQIKFLRNLSGGDTLPLAYIDECAK